MSAQSTYPLSPLQQGMLFHALAEPHSGVDIEQLVFTLCEPVQPERLRAAWERVIARHGILRTAFHWDGAEPLQEVHSAVEVPFVIEDASSMDDASFAAWLLADRTRGFAMDAAPLLRFHLFRYREAQWCLVWTFHHALLDGRSFPPLIEEAFGTYDSPEAAAPPEPRPYRDFIEWHRAQEHGPAEAFWRGKLKGFRAPTPLAIEGLGTLSPAREQGDTETTLSVENTAALKTFAAELGVTLNTLVQGAWAVLLHRYSGEEDICFGATRAARRGTVEGADAMIGLFINTVPVRARVSDEQPLASFLRSLRQDWVDVRPYEHTPLARVQAWSDVPAGQPLFRTLVVFENYDLATHFRTRGGPWEGRDVRLFEQTNFPICLAAYASEQLRLAAEFDRSRLDEQLVRAALEHLHTLLEALPGCRDGVVGDLPLLRPEVAAAMLEDQSTSFPVSETLHAQFSRQAAKTPEAIALVQGDRRMTYAELETRANAVAAYLAAHGVRTESIVGLCLERCPELVVALLGILKANAAYLPIDLAYPPERLAFMLEDAQAPVLLTQRHLADRLPPGHGAELVFIEDIATTPATSAPSNAGTPGQLCYVLYTSGSTGKPKGCCITHRNVARLFTATDAWFHFGEQDVWTLFHSTAFDFSVWELWGALLYGGTLVVVPFEVSRSPEQFHELLVRERVTVLNQTPSAFRQLMAADEAAPPGRALSLRSVIFGGEALEMRSLAPWFARHGDAKPQLVNMYGITETTVHVTYRPLKAGDVARGSVIGEPIPDLQLLVLDARLRPAPLGVAGELFVGGAGLARGYHQRPELTEARFIPHPAVPGAHLYRTGDLARRLPDGELEYLGRIDHQVKIRGFRIELGEIESVLARHPRIREAAVLARDDGHGGKKLVAWVVENPDAPAVTAADLRAHLKASLPDYMVPTAFVRMPQMPLTNNGKLDARALPPPPEERAVATAFMAPGTPAEQALAEIWQRVLKLPRVGIHDNFFELGGDSILTILVVSQARSRGLNLTPKQLFDHPTIAALAEHATSGQPAVARLAEQPATGEVPLTPIQRWFFTHDFAEPHHWNQSFTAILNRSVTREQLAAAFAQVVAAHPVFRLRYERGGHGWRQIFEESLGPAPGSFEFFGDPIALQSSLSLQGPLLRYAYVPERGTLTIAIHHLAVDGVSWRVLFADLDAALRGVALPMRTTGFHTWAHAIANAKPAPSEEVHWKSLPAPTPLPRDRDGGANLEASARTVVFALEPTQTATLRAMKVQEVLLAALAHALTELTGRREHVIEMEGHGREEALLTELADLAATPDLSHTIGWFTTIYPVRLRAMPTPRETLAETAAHLASIPSRGFACQLRGETSRAPSAEVLFNYLGQFDQTVAGLEGFHLEPLATSHWHAPTARRTHVLELNALILHNRLEVRLSYSEDLHRAETIEHFAAGYHATLLSLLGGSARFPLAKLDEPQLAQITARYPASEDIYPLSPMQRLFFALEKARPGSGMDQWHCRIVGSVDISKLQQAWRQVAHRHAPLRTAYVAEGPEPHQVVVAEAAPEWFVEDWRGQPAGETEQKLAVYLAADAARPFDLAKPPLTRFALFRLAEDGHLLVWTHHHLEIDGWSWPLVFRELHEALSGTTENQPIALPRYRDYLDWLASRPADPAFWKTQLQGFRQPTPLPLAPADGSPMVEVTASLDTTATGAIATWARRHHVTVNAIVQLAWATVLAHHSGSNDVIFGAAFSGRPAELPGSERIIGHFVNNLPIRVRLPSDESVAELAQRLHSYLAEIAEHQYTPLGDIEACSDLPWNARLFSSLVVFQNYLADQTRLGAARIVDLHAPVRTNYPLTLVVNPGEKLTLTLVARPSVTDAAALENLGRQLFTVLAALDSANSIEHLRALLPAPVPQMSAPLPRPASRADSATALERTIAEVWQAAFGREVSVSENFFDLGGHSLLMLRVQVRLSEKLGREIPVVTLFQHPTIRSLAGALGDAAEASGSAQISAAQDRGAKARAALARRPVLPRKP